MSYKNRNELNLQKKKELESVFIEILNSKRKNTIIGYIYKYPCMNPSEFNNTYLKELL